MLGFRDINKSQTRKGMFDQATITGTLAAIVLQCLHQQICKLDYHIKLIIIYPFHLITIDTKICASSFPNKLHWQLFPCEGSTKYEQQSFRLVKPKNPSKRQQLKNPLHPHGNWICKYNRHCAVYLHSAHYYAFHHLNKRFF